MNTPKASLALTLLGLLACCGLIGCTDESPIPKKPAPTAAASTPSKKVALGKNVFL